MESIYWRTKAGIAEWSRLQRANRRAIERARKIAADSGLKWPCLHGEPCFCFQEQNQAQS